MESMRIEIIITKVIISHRSHLMNTINTHIKALPTLQSTTPSNQLLHMTTKEAQRHNIITQAVEKKISEATAAEKLALSIRQIQRLKQALRTE